MTEIRLRKIEVEGLREVRDAGTRGLTIYPRQGFFCSGRLQMTQFRILAGLGLVEVVDGKILISAAGLEHLDGVP